MNEVTGAVVVPEAVSPIEAEQPASWWEGEGKQWKLGVADRLKEVTTGKALLEQYPEMTRDVLIQLKNNLLRKGHLDACDAAVEVIIGALGSLTIKDLDPSTYPAHLLDPHYKAHASSGTLRQTNQEADF